MNAIVGAALEQSTLLAVLLVAVLGGGRGNRADMTTARNDVVSDGRDTPSGRAAC
jgi:hypothetical protein